MGMILNTDFSTIEPNEGGGRRSFPISDSRGWLARIVKTEGAENSAKNGKILRIELEGMEGAVVGKFHDHTINITNPSQKAVEIGQGECSAIAHVTGHLRVGNSDEWVGKLVRVEIVSDASEQYPNATKIRSWRDQNGNTAKQALQGTMQNGGGNLGGAQQGQNGGGFGGGAQNGQQGQQNGGGWGNGQPQGGGNGNVQQGQNGGGFNGGGFQPNGQQGGGFQGGGDPNANQQGGGFGGNAQQGGFQGGNGAGNNGGFQGGGQQGGGPGWNRT